MSKTEPLQAAFHFVPIGHGLWLDRPDSYEAGDAIDPQLILIFGWMAARLQHLDKYAQTYRDMYPSSVIILVQCERSFFFSMPQIRRTVLQPVVDYLKSWSDEASQKDDTPRILVHAFSNGGASQLITLSTMLKGVSFVGPTTNALIFDSTPGMGGITTALRAFTSHVSNPLLKSLAYLFICLLYLYWIIIAMLTGKSWIRHLKDSLNEKELLPWTNKNTPRLYICSKGDKLVPWQQVWDHVEAAKKKCLVAKCKVFETSDHVAHMRLDPEAYWGSVKGIWSVAQKVSY